MKAPILIPMEELIAKLEEQLPELEWEADREWLWITTDLAPHRGKCDCQQCQERAEIRKKLFKHGLGFIFAKNGHTCPSGAVSYAGHHCEKPIGFRRKSKGKTTYSSNPTDEPEVSDAELLAMLG